MAMMTGSPYKALIESGASAESAKKAAEDVADYQKQLADIPTDLTLVRTLLGVIVTGVAALVTRTFFG